MSDAISNREMNSREIEDVLTSVRRLVARENARPAAGQVLVLTPAHRVETAQEARPETEPDTGKEGEDEAANRPCISPAGQAGSGTGLPATDDRAVAGALQPAQVPASEQAETPAAPVPDPEAPDPGAPGSSTPEPWASDLRAQELARLQETPDKLEIAAAAAPLRDRGREPAPPLFGRAAPAQRPDATAGDKTCEPGDDAGDVTAAATAEVGFQDDAGPGSRPGSGRGSHRGGRSVPDAEPEEADVVPDSPRVETPAPPEAAATHQTAEDRDPPPKRETAPAAGQADEAEDGIIETLIDEDMLRALVAQLVRDELRGQLGERITLQVRKLVRAEIARALDERQYL